MALLAALYILDRVSVFLLSTLSSFLFLVNVLFALELSPKFLDLAKPFACIYNFSRVVEQTVVVLSYLSFLIRNTKILSYCSLKKYTYGIMYRC